MLEIDISRVDNKGNSVLHYAAIYNASELIDPYLKLGIDPHIKNQEEQTPTQLAKLFNNLDFASELA